MLRDERVRELISRRAYEIYVMRGGKPGGEGHDWFQAESEILSILIEEESRRAAESVETDADEGPPPVDEADEASPVGEAIGVPETSDRLEQESGLMAEERAESQSAITAWSPTEPPGTERAPVIGDVGEFQTGEAAPKKTGSRAAAKPAAPRKSKSSTEEPAAKEPAAKKTTAKRTASKKSAGPPKKTTRSRKKTS